MATNLRSGKKNQDESKTSTDLSSILKHLRKCKFDEFNGNVASWEIFKFSVLVNLNSIDTRLSALLKEDKIPADHLSDSDLCEWHKSASGIVFAKLFAAMPTDLRLLLMHLPHWTFGNAGLVDNGHADSNKDLINTAHPSIVWAKLCERFEPKNIVEQQNLINKFMNSRMDTSKSDSLLVELFQNFYTKLLADQARLKNIGEPISDGVLRLVLLNGLPKSDVLDHELGNWKTLAFNQLLDKLVEFFSERDSMASRAKPVAQKPAHSDATTSDSKLLATRAVSKTHLKCSLCGRMGHTVDRCWSKKTCRLCGKLGHIDKFCPDSDSGCDYCGLPDHEISDCRVKARAEALKAKKASTQGEKLGCIFAENDNELV